MDLYLVLKSLHILAAIVWVGGGLFMTFMLLLAGRDPEARLRQFEAFAAAGAIMMPASLIVLLSGIVATWLGAWGFAPWIDAALVGAAISFAIGAIFMGPGFARIGTLRAAGDNVSASAALDRLLYIARSEQVLLLAVVLLMIAKPGWTGVLAITLIAVAAVVAMTLARPRGPRMATAA